MIRKLEDKDIDKVMNIWLESTIKAHDFIPKEYWESNYDTVKEVYIPIADSFIYEEKGKILLTFSKRFAFKEQKNYNKMWKNML